MITECPKAIFMNNFPFMLKVIELFVRDTVIIIIIFNFISFDGIRIRFMCTALDGAVRLVKVGRSR